MESGRRHEQERRGWGGARPGAGRKPKGDKAGVSHLRRPSLPGWFPVHVTVRMQRGVWSLRAARSLRVLADAFAAGRSRRGFRLVHYAVGPDHIHFLVEAESRRALSLGMQGLCIRIARGLNRAMKRSGRVFADRYHAAVLRTRDEVRRVRNLLAAAAPFASTTPVVPPETALLAESETAN